MEEYRDERFIAMLKERQEMTQNRDIQQGSVYVDGDMVEFAEREIFPGRLFMWMPREFELLSKNLAQIKYPNASRPDIIYSNAQATVNVAFARKAEKLLEGQEEDARDYFEQVIHRLQPASSTIEKQTQQAGGKQIAWFDFVSPAIDSDIYNLMFFASIGRQLLMGTCNCLKPEQNIWKELFIQMIASARFA